MAVYFVFSGAGGAGTGADWTNAFTTLAAGLAAASSDGDVIKVHKTHQESVGVMTFAASYVSIIVVDKDASDALATMGAGGWITATNVVSGFAGSVPFFIYGLHWITTGSSSGRSPALVDTDGGHGVYENCWIDQQNTNAASVIGLGTNNNTDRQAYVEMNNCTLSFANAGQYLSIGGHVVINGGSIDSAGTAPGSTGLFHFSRVDPGGANLEVFGCNLTHMDATTPTLVANSTTQAFLARFVQCKTPSGLAYLATQTHLNRSSGEVWLHDCAVGDTHGLFVYANAQGSVTSDTGIKFTGGAAGQSWKVVTTAYCRFGMPFVTPWVDLYHTGTSSITPRLEILRDGSATAYQDDEVWGEFVAKTNSGNVLPAFSRDRMTILGTPANQAAGSDTWDGENATHWAGKVDSGSAFTPAEAGHIRGRLVVGEPSITVYVDPFIRT